MYHENVPDVTPIKRPPQRKFVVERVDPENLGWRDITHVTAHLVFNNKNRGEGLIFRRYYDDSVKTEVVAEFEPGHFAAYYEVD